MIVRRTRKLVVAVSENNWFPLQWFRYRHPTPAMIHDRRGRTIVLHRNDIFGLKEFTRNEDVLMALRCPRRVAVIPWTVSEVLVM